MRFAKSILVLLLLSSLVGSCSKSKDQITVAQVNDRVITLEMFEKTYFTVDPKFLPEDKGKEGRLEFLNTMINRDVMAIKADELGFDKDPYVIQGMEAFKKVGLQAAYLKFKVADKIKVTDGDLKKAYDKYQTNLQIKQILVDTEEEGNEVYELLQQGHDFESVCKQYSKGPEAAVGGKARNALWGTFEPNFQDILFDTPVGGVTPPIKSRYGYFVVKVLSKNQPKRQTFEEVKPDLEILVENQQQIRLTNQASDEIREKHNFQWYEDNISIVFEALPPDRPLTTPPDRSKEVYPLLDIDPQGLDKPIVSYDDKNITVREFSDLYDGASFFNRPRREFRWGGIKNFIVDIVMNELVAIEIEESKIEEEPQIALALQKKREQFMVDKLFQDVVAKNTVVSEAEIADYYSDNLEQFRRDEERRLGVILTGDREKAAEARERVLAGEFFAQVSAEYSLEELSREERAGRFLKKGQNPEYDEVGFAMEVGDISEPFATSQGWVVLKLFERRPERILPLSEARSSIEKALLTLKNEERLNTLLEKWRSEMDIVVNENNLMKANLEDRPKKKKRAVRFG